ncbi:MAG: nitroreductase family protein [Candidatus Omnitrophica bacterium CG11_big_fil_rev_8_21_14_0_20_42_13]|uniref:Nitroreductase family protein n=1 Tax=Candidatus Ghiorseimicrobium undicola TaxID=1974746 RepID=A0A2H0M0Q3_9BACT|nr:MAG: nitroreductase family protein [Candidatus Omnitrophica bacterium CG11_big_fil_rev_8_21_14_0_20_42_13]
MEMLDYIRQRRAVRRYKDAVPEEGYIEKILEAGRWAPSGLNNQPWRFLVIKDKERKAAISKFTKYAKIIESAPVLVIVCMDVADSYNRDKDLMAIGACIQNILLEAHSLDMGACWLGEILNNKGRLSKYLGLDDDFEIMAVLAVGFSDEELTEGCRKPLMKLMIKADEN